MYKKNTNENLKIITVERTNDFINNMTMNMK